MKKIYNHQKKELTKFLVTLSIVLLQFTLSYAQFADQTLSNLTSTTAVNQILLPQDNNKFDLGSGSKSWKNFYSDGSIYLNGFRFLSNGNNANNVFIGTKAGNNSSGVANVFAGAYAGYSNTTGHDNTAIGYFAMYSNAVTYENTAVGSLALFANTSGYYNTAIGYTALQKNVSGYYNTAVGTQALDATVTSGNTALGERAGAIYKNGWGNTFIGQQTWANADGYQYSTCLGYNSKITASNQVRIGSSSVTSIGGYKAWTNLSDGRFKKNIKENVPGLAFINKLRPITFNMDVQSINKHLSENRPSINEDGEKIIYPEEDKTAIAQQEKIISTGFVAQEVEKAAKDLNYDFDGVDGPKNENDFYGLRYSEFVVPLVKAVQELSKTNDEKEVKIEDLEKRLSNLETLLSVKAGNSSVQNISLSAASLEQNTPNPFTSGTTINYNLPPKFFSAKIIVTDKNGKTLKQINITGSGRGSLQIGAPLLSSGAYNYSLYVNDNLVDTKQMLWAK